MLKRLCSLLLGLLLAVSCAAAEGSVILAPYAHSAEEQAYALLLGLDTPHLIYTFDTGRTEGCFRVNVYALQDGRWLMANTQRVPLAAASGRLALACDRLEESLRIAVQTEANTDSIVCHPLFGMMTDGFADNQVSLSEPASVSWEAELPLVIQSASEELLSLTAFSDPAGLLEPSYAITIAYEVKEKNP